MSYSIFWTPEAEKTFNQNLDYLAIDRDTQVVDVFLDRVEAVLEQVRMNPLIFPAYRHFKDVHRCVIHERMILVYRIVDQETIHLLSFWNTRQDPGRLRI